MRAEGLLQYLHRNALKETQMDKVTALFNELYQAFMRTLRFGVGLIGRMSPPALLGAALVLAFICSILPLALVLFAVFMLLKVAVGVSVISRRQRPTPYKDVE